MVAIQLPPEHAYEAGEHHNLCKVCGLREGYTLVHPKLH